MKNFENKVFTYHKYTSGAWQLWIGNFCQIGKDNKDYPKQWGYTNLYKKYNIDEPGTFKRVINFGHIYIFW